MIFLKYSAINLAELSLGSLFSFSHLDILLLVKFDCLGNVVLDCLLIDPLSICVAYAFFLCLHQFPQNHSKFYLIFKVYRIRFEKQHLFSKVIEFETDVV